MGMPSQSELLVGRACFRTAIPEIAVAARYLDDAVSAHLLGDARVAEELIRAADMRAIRDWTESLWGKASHYVQYRLVAGAPKVLKRDARVKVRMPSRADQRLLHARDGYHCRFCEIPVVRPEVRRYLSKFYPAALPWGRSNATQHAAFQAMWAQYDHLLPHARGGNNDLENVIVTCAPCNFGRMDYTLDEVGLADPRMREPIRSSWDGLERVLS
jgi:HNH endonuclease